MKSLRSEMLSLMTVLAVPAMLAVVFPYSSLGFRGMPEPRPAGDFAAFVTLSAEAEAAAVRAAKTSWRGEDAVGDRLRAELRLGELPAPDASPVLSIDSRNRPVAGSRTPLPMPAYLPSQAASHPARLPANDMPVAEPVFSRKELLEIH